MFIGDMGLMMAFSVLQMCRKAPLSDLISTLAGHGHCIMVAIPDHNPPSFHSSHTLDPAFTRCHRDSCQWGSPWRKSDVCSLPSVDCLFLNFVITAEERRKLFRCLTLPSRRRSTVISNYCPVRMVVYILTSCLTPNNSEGRW